MEVSKLKTGFQVIIILGLIIGIGWFFLHPNNYVNNYFSVVGMPKRHLYKYAMEKYGEPDFIIPYGKGYTIAKHDGIEFVLLETKDATLDGSYVECVRIYNPEIKFGWRKIGVSSTREEIERVYKRFKKIKEADCGYIDGLTWIEFYFDEEQKVNKIVIYCGP